MELEHVLGRKSDRIVHLEGPLYCQSQCQESGLWIGSKSKTFPVRLSGIPSPVAGQQRLTPGQGRF